VQPPARYPHPANHALLQALQARSEPARGSGYDLDGFELHAHPDLCDHLYALNPHCKEAAYGYPVLATERGILFAVAIGTSFLALRLADRERAAAVDQGGRAFAEAGTDWVSVEAWGVEAARLKDLAKAALACAEEIARSGTT
jgi:hypothetical protein